MINIAASVHVVAVLVCGGDPLLAIPHVPVDDIALLYYSTHSPCEVKPTVGPKKLFLFS
jgi:hypothetical protein